MQMSSQGAITGVQGDLETAWKVGGKMGGSSSKFRNAEAVDAWVVY